MSEDSPSAMKKWAARIGIALAMGTTLVWIGAIAMTGSIKPIGQLQDTTFPRAAEEICARHVDIVKDLPNASESKTVEDRVEVIRFGADELQEMTNDMRAVVPDTDDAKYINEWIDDWQLHVDDRNDYADRLENVGPGEDFLESVRDTKQISKSIDRYAKINHMASCQTPPDV